MSQSTVAQLVKVSMSKARDDFSDTVDLARVGRDRVVLHRHGKGVAAVISMEDLGLLEFLERRLTHEEVKAARAALAEARAKGEEPVSWETLKETLGLERKLGRGGIYKHRRIAGKKAGRGRSRAAAAQRGSQSSD